MAELLDTFSMETNFEGLIQLLAKHLYPEPDVFIRELIQNAHDSIARRQQHETDLGGRIEVLADPSSRTITFTDNGIGMDQHDIKTFLAVIGSTGTGAARQLLSASGDAAAHELIGQFGIGLLSAFVVAESVVVHTRKYGAESAFCWHNFGSADCKLYSDDRHSVGTDVVVTLSDDYSFMLDEKRLREVIMKYCDFVPFPINVNGQGPVNAIEAPWYRTHWSSDAEKDATYKQFLNRRYPDVPLDVIPIEIDAPYRARGALYISDRHIPDVNTTGVVDIYVRRISVRLNDNTLLPPWAKFVRGVIDSPDLQPTAGRDNIQRDQHPAFEFLRARLGEIIVQRLSHLARTEPNEFRQINLWHHYHLKGMAFYYDDFFEQVIEMLLFETNKGRLNLPEYLTKNATRDNKAPIYYFAYQGGAAQFNRLADARGWVVINAGYRFDQELLEKYAKRNQRMVHLELLDTTDDPELFQRLEPTELDRFRQLEWDMEAQLHRLGLANVMVQMRRYAPVDLPSVMVLSPENEAEEKLRDLLTTPFFMEAMEDVVQETLAHSRRRPTFLSLNASNPLIQKLVEANRQDPMVHDVMTGVYNSAILYSHNLLNQHNASVIHGQFVHLLDGVVGHLEDITRVQQALEHERHRFMDLRRQTNVGSTQSDHVLLFMITPFANEYKKIEQAVRRVFERPPYYFEVQSARDYTHKPGLLDDIWEHMARAHGFIADISDLNPNVMFELGAAMLLERLTALDEGNRPVFSLRGREAVLEVPADLREKLRVSYGSIADTVESLEAEIRSAFERDGRPTNDSIVALLNARKKRFLSRALLESLRMRLDEVDIGRVMANFSSLDELLELNSGEVSRISGLPEFVVAGIKGELKEQLGE